MLIAALAVTSAAIANIERTDDQTLAETQARDLAQHISDIGSRDPKRSRAPQPDQRLSTQHHERACLATFQGDFVEETRARKRTPRRPYRRHENVLRGCGHRRQRAHRFKSVVVSRFRNHFENGRPSGAVEIVQRFDSIWAVRFVI
jgi:hypothetical protein